ncbi:hypothetical protein ACG0Z6_13265 [Roseateles sp. BYS180W]|uniref:Phasin domain-containing protein n=1 Tax=Roseateles rivi TaxID=3299028 RepID=A0ABW7FY14_9BURK
MSRAQGNTATFQPVRMPGAYAAEHGIWATMPGSAMAHLLGQVRDIAQGVQTVLEMLERDDAEAEARRMMADAQAPILSPLHREQLHRLAIASSALLAQRAEQWCDQLDANARKAEQENSPDVIEGADHAADQ